MNYIDEIARWKARVHDVEEQLVKAAIMVTEARERADSAESSREMRAGVRLLETARDLGWPDEGEGAQEFIMRRAYEQGKEDTEARVDAEEGQ